MSNVPDFPLVDPRDDGIRPAGAPDECFYCKQKVGTPHLYECTAVSQKVRIRATFEIDVTMPYHWNLEDIEEWLQAENFQLELAELKKGILQDVEFVSVMDPTPRIKTRPADDQPESFGNN
jgi:hypothetical protein